MTAFFQPRDVISWRRFEQEDLCLDNLNSPRLHVTVNNAIRVVNKNLLFSGSYGWKSGSQGRLVLKRGAQPQEEISENEASLLTAASSNLTKPC